jgi:hypothetical protein
MNHKYITLGITVIVAAVAITAIGFAAPQQALAHYSHHHHHHHNNNGEINVNQQTNQANICDNQGLCLNNANNTADISR